MIATRPTMLRAARRGLTIAIIGVCVAVWSAPVSADPPPWAPAHGYRAKHKSKHRKKGYEVEEVYVPPFDIDIGRCNREALGSLLGAAAGGYAGSRIGSGDGNLTAVAGGTLLGFLVGGAIGRMMDDVDQHCIGQALEHGQDGQPIIWNDPDTGGRYEVVPKQTFQRSDGRYCREYTTTAVVGGKSQQTYGTACRQTDGAWELIS